MMKSRKSAFLIAEPLESRLLVTGTIYVDASAIAPWQDGTSWSHAYQNLQQALAIAVVGDEIHVAKGIYLPSSGNDRTAAFRLKTGVKLLGGYAGTLDPYPNNRDIKNNLTVLSGDIGKPGISSDNAMRVVLGGGTDSTSVIEGFLITASGSGLGISNGTGSPTISKCTFTRCTSSAISNGSSSAALITECTFQYNTAQTNGGAIVNNPGSAPSISQCLFQSNSVLKPTALGTGGGGAIASIGSSPFISNCRFIGNSVGQSSNATEGGGAIYSSKSTLSLINCTFEDNSAPTMNGGAVWDASTASKILGCTFIHNVAAYGGAIAGSTPNSEVIESSFLENKAGDGGAIYGVLGTWTITSCTFTRNIAGDGKTTGTGGALYFKYSNTSSAVGCAFNGNQAGYRGGAAYSLAMVFSSTFTGNYAGESAGATLYFATATNCTFTANSSGIEDSVGVYNANNCILWRNIATVEHSYNFELCDVDMGSNFNLGSNVESNVNVDPQFLRNPDPGPDKVWGTSDDDYGDLRLKYSSPLIDAGSNAKALDLSLDDDGVDAAGRPRFQDIATVPDTGVGPAPVIDIGAYEAVPTLMASASGPYCIATGHATHLFGYGVSDVPGRLRFDWEWTGDGLFDDGTGTTPAFSTAGYSLGTVIPVMLRVTDAQGRSVVDNTTITVAQPFLYVDANANGANNGRNWVDAYTSVTVALARVGKGQTIKVAAGVYKPTFGSDRYASFQLKDEVTLLGGFAGNESSDPEARDVLSYQAVLSGEIGSAEKLTDNSVHVVVASDVGRSAVIDGFTVTAGYANVDPYGYQGWSSGAGLYAKASDANISNCTFVDNFALNNGGGSLSNGGSLEFNSCTFLRNKSEVGGGGLSLSSDAVVKGCKFYGNTSRVGGGAALFRSSLMVNCIFVGNTATLYGGAIWDSGGQFSFTAPSVINCTVSANVGGAIYENYATGIYENVIAWGNSDNDLIQYQSHPTILSSDIGVDPQFVRNASSGGDHLWGTADDDYGDLRLRITSPCIDAGYNTAVTTTTDLAGNARIVDMPGVNNPGAKVDMGANERAAPWADGNFLFNAPHQTVTVQFGFDVSPSSIGAADLVLTNLTTNHQINVVALVSVAYDPLTRTASWVFSSTLPDGDYRATLPQMNVTDLNGDPALGTDLNFGFFILGGDANRDRTVDIRDVAILAANWQGSPKAFAQGDFNYDGQVNAADLGILSANWQRVLSPPPTILSRTAARPPARILKQIT